MAVEAVPTLIAGIFGMNFNRMPGIHCDRGFPLVVFIMAAVAGFLCRGLRKSGWLWDFRRVCHGTTTDRFRPSIMAPPITQGSQMSLHRRSRLTLGHTRWHHRWHVRSETPTRLGPDFARIWGAGVMSNLADGITFAALPLVSALLTRNPILVALTAVVHSLPWLGFELIAGDIVDRVDRKRLMVWGNLARSAGVGLVAVLVATDGISLAILYVIAFGIGIAETLVDTSWEAIVPRLVPVENLELANGRTQAAEWAANDLLGPPIGGLLFVAAASVPFFVDAGAFVLAAVLLATIPGSFRSEREVAHGQGAMRREIGDGIKWLWEHKVLRTLSLMAGISNLVGTAMFSVFVLFAQDILGLNELGFGLVLSAAGIGGLAGAAVAHRVERRLGPGTLLLGSMAGLALSAFAVAVTSTPLIVALAFTLDGILIGMWNVVVVSLRQTLVPDEMRGRVAADARTIAFGAIPLGAILGGVLGDWIGLRAPFFVGTAVYLIAVPLVARIVSNKTIADLKAQAGDGG